MKNRLPVNIENLDLPIYNNKKINNDSYGFVNILNILSIIITGISMIIILAFVK